MTDKVVPLKRPGRASSNQRQDRGIAGLALRLDRIERVIAALTWRIGVVLCGYAGLLAIEIIQTLKGGL